QGLQEVVDEADEAAPDQKQYCFRCGGGGKHIDDRGDEHNGSNLEDSGEEEHQCPQAGAGESCDEEAEAGEYGLDDGYAEDSVGDASDRRCCELLELGTLIAEEAVCERVRDCDAT